jgi:hypothetical protein
MRSGEQKEKAPQIEAPFLFLASADFRFDSAARL